MGYRGNFDKTSLFLREYAYIFQTEVLNTYPQFLSTYPSHWIDALTSLDAHQLWSFEQKDCGEHVLLPSELLYVCQTLNQLCEVSVLKSNTFTALPPWAFSGVKLKKQHEILQILKLIDQVRGSKKIKRITDIGGGVGHLARTLAHYRGIETTSLDMNANFQSSGRLRAKKYPLPQEHAPLHFTHFHFGVQENDQQLNQLFTASDLVIGLHTCGNLAKLQLQTCLKYQTPMLINFGCCYAKMTEDNQQNISQHAKANQGIHFSKYALTLATRSHQQVSFDDFLIKKQVKRFRYSLQLFLQQKLGLTDFISVGDMPPKSYSGKFSQYLLKKLKELNIPCSFTEQEVDDFYHSSAIKKLTQKMFAADCIRWKFGRAIEITILLDRVIYLLESGRTAELIQTFDESKSPRNIAIFSATTQQRSDKGNRP